MNFSLAHTRSSVPTPGHPVMATIFEALEAFATRAIATRVLARALRQAGESEVPRKGEPLQRFIDDHLLPATGELLDPDTAEALAGTLGPLLARIPAQSETPSDIREVVPAEDPAAITSAGTIAAPTTIAGLLASGAPAATEAATKEPLLTAEGSPSGALDAVLVDVVVATVDEERLASLAHAIPRSATTLYAEDVVTMLELLQQPRDEAPFIVVDCLHPSVHPTTLATVGAELPLGTNVVLWGVTEREEAAIARLLENTAGWHHLPADAGADAVAAKLRALLLT
ncbi:MAG: hypothetical protein AAGH15_13515 [Myxococcota bacterium]